MRKPLVPVPVALLEPHLSGVVSSVVMEFEKKKSIAWEFTGEDLKERKENHGVFCWMV